MARRKYKGLKQGKNLTKIGETFLGNYATVKIIKNDKPDGAYDNYRVNLRVAIEYKQGRHKVMPTLNLYNATDAEIALVEQQLTSAIISLRNARHKLGDVNGYSTVNLPPIIGEE